MQSTSELESRLNAMRTSEVPGRVVERVPVIPMRDLVVYPDIVIPLFAGRTKTIQAAETAMRGDKRVAVVTPRQPDAS